jgi:hypothetical protein
LVFVVEYVAADAPLADIAITAKATTDAHNIVERFIIISSLEYYFLPGVDPNLTVAPLEPPTNS